MATTTMTTATDEPGASERSSRAWVMPAAVAVLSAAVFALIHRHLIDDSFITLSYARNLALHGHWGLIELDTSNTATSPLNVLLLATITVVTRDAVLAAGVLYVLCQVAIAVALRRLGARAGLPTWFSPLAVLLLTVNPILLSSVGLEIQLGAAGVAWLLVAAAERRTVLLGVLTGLLVLVRVDLLLIALAIFVLRSRFWEGMGKSVLAALAVTLPWYLFSWVVLGSAVPDTLIIKTLQKSWGPWDFTNGPLLYEMEAFWGTWLSLVPAILGVVAFLGWLALGRRRDPVLLPFMALAPAAVLHYASYSRLHVPPYHWYYGPSIIAGTLFLAASVAALAARGPVLVRRAPAVLVAAAVVVFSVANYLSTGLPRVFAPVMSNHASSDQYRAIGEELHRIVGSGTVRSGGEIGVLAYSCGCAIVDVFSDRGAVPGAITARKDQAGLIARKLIDLNFHFLNHDLKEITPQYALTPTPVGAPVPANVITQWRITSPWTGPQELYLVRAT
jgi:hypothetical protein